MMESILRTFLFISSNILGMVSLPEVRSGEEHLYDSCLTIVILFLVYIVVIAIRGIVGFVSNKRSTRNPDYDLVYPEQEGKFVISDDIDEENSLQEPVAEEGSAVGQDVSERKEEETIETYAEPKRDDKEPTGENSPPLPGTPPSPRHTPRASRVAFPVNVWYDVYGCGLALFTSYYCMDMTAFLPSNMFLVGMMMLQFSLFTKIFQIDPPIPHESATNRMLTLCGTIAMSGCVLTSFMQLINFPRDTIQDMIGQFTYLQIV